MKEEVVTNYADNMPKLTIEEAQKILEYAWHISDYIYEQDKVGVYAESIKDVFDNAYRRQKGR